MKMSVFYNGSYVLLGVILAVTFYKLVTSVFQLSTRMKQENSLFNTSLLFDHKTFPSCDLHLSSESRITSYLGAMHVPRHPACRHFQQIFDNMYLLRISDSKLQLKPEKFMERMKGWLGNSEQLLQQAELQKLVRVTNRFTQEETLMNALRDKRPVPPKSNLQKFADDLIRDSLKDCDFCDYKRKTAEDVFGRIESKYSSTVANAFKLDQYHSMVVFRQHDPIKWNLTVFMDAMHSASLWFKKVVEREPSCIYHHIYWDMLPKAGGSQIHPHLHMTANSHGIHGLMAVWQHAALQYAEKYSRNFYSDLLYIHYTLTLAVTLPNAALFAHINPRKDNEVIIIGNSDAKDFNLLLYAVIRVYMDEMKLYAISCLVTFPTKELESSTPIIARLATRGDISERRSDVSSLELFSASNVNSDPKNIAVHVKRFVDRLKIGPD